MEENRNYLERKYEELSLISGCLRRSEASRPTSIEAVIEEKFRLAAQLKSECVLRAWRSTETGWCTTPFRSGPFSFRYRYQRADLTVSGPSPYRDLDSIAEAEPLRVVYTCSGMGAVSAVLLALSAGQNTVLIHLPGCYKETLELAANCIPELQCNCLAPERAVRTSSRQHTILWLDAPPSSSAVAAEIAPVARAADAIVFDTTCFSAASARIRAFVRWAGRVETPVILIRSHTKLDTLGIEYGRLGSAMFIASGNSAFRRRRVAELAGKTENAARLLGNKALPAQFCPFAGSPNYWGLYGRRSAALLRNGRHLARTLTRRLGRATVRNYQHGMFAALVPPHNLGEADSAGESEQIAASLARHALPVRHAGSFGFDFVAIEGFFDTQIDRHVIRIAVGDVPPRVAAEVAERIASWWTARWSARAA